ncbi:MAG: hypothetical protein ACK5JT_20760 [Hyphomicrobiaceae bacterium]
MSSGKSEVLKCRAYYTSKEKDGLGLAIRCASASNRIELRAHLHQEAGQVSGRWEERTYNATGNVTGRARQGKINLSIVGGGFSGSMAVATNGSSQTVTIETQGVGLKSVDIKLSRA